MFDFIILKPKQPDVFEKLESFTGDRIPEIVIKVLKAAGYVTESILKLINEEEINKIEEYVRKNRIILKGTSYENENNFEFLPGHRVFLSNLPNDIGRMKEVNKNLPQIEKSTANCSHFPFMLKALIETAESNSNGHPSGNRFNKNVQDFATYIYMMCGRACYDTLSANLPIPKSNTICMHRAMRNFSFVIFYV